MKPVLLKNYTSVYIAFNALLNTNTCIPCWSHQLYTGQKQLSGLICGSIRFLLLFVRFHKSGFVFERAPFNTIWTALFRM